MKKTTITTTEGRFSYLKVFTATPDDRGKDKWGTAFLISKKDKAGVKLIKDAIEAAFEEGRAKLGVKDGVKMPTTIKNPLRDGDEERPEDPNYEGMYFFNANAAKKPGVVDRQRQAILDPDGIKSGDYGRLNVTFYAFNVDKNKGIAVGPNHVQLTRPGEALDGRVAVEDAFGEDDFQDDETDDIL